MAISKIEKSCYSYTQAIISPNGGKRRLRKSRATPGLYSSAHPPVILFPFYSLRMRVGRSQTSRDSRLSTYKLLGLTQMSINHYTNTKYMWAFSLIIITGIYCGCTTLLYIYIPVRAYGLARNKDGRARQKLKLCVVQQRAPWSY